MFTPQGFLMSQLPVSMQVTTPSAMNFTGFQPGLDLMPDGESALNFAGPTSPVPGAASATQTPEYPGSVPAGSSVLDDIDEKNPEFKDGANTFLKMFTDDEFRQKLLREKGQYSRDQMRDAYMMKRLRDMPDEAKQGYQEMGNIYGQAGANIANILGATQVPQAQINAQAPGAIAPRSYFK
jgi:hypothetical protein